MKTAVLGCGRWGTFLAWYARRLGHEVTLWGRPGSERLEQLRSQRQNEYLELQPDVSISNDLEETLNTSQNIIISISAQSLRDLGSQIKSALNSAPNFILCMKGLEIGSGKRLSEVFFEETGKACAIWVGPGHVQSFKAGVPNCMVVDGPPEIQQAVISAFGSDLIRFYYGTDLIGNEIGAAAKNVVGIAAGMLDGLELTALKGALMARAPRELSRLIKAKGGNEMTAYGLAHLGDYEATLFSPHSNNRRFGEDFVKGLPFQKLAEGVPTLKAMNALAEQSYVDLPICKCLSRVLFEDKEPRNELNTLFDRSIKREFV